jgi:hypothetical protein
MKSTHVKHNLQREGRDDCDFVTEVFNYVVANLIVPHG